MNKISVGCDLQYSIEAETTFLFNVSVARTPRQTVLQDVFQLSPHVEMQFFSMGMTDNRVQRVRLFPCEFRFHYEAQVTLESGGERATGLNELSYRDLPPEVLPYLNPSRFCESDLVGDFATSEFGSVQQGHSRVEAICNWIHQHIQYANGSTNARTTACDVLIQRRGVCRDFAHLGITFCRALSIPARYVSGYALALDPPDFHGFFEAFLGERWYLFDPTRLAPVNGLVRIATGLDAADVPFATLIGSATLTAKSVWATPVDGSQSGPTGNGGPAISTA